jgi:YHS domain-containing protein
MLFIVIAYLAYRAVKSWIVRNLQVSGRSNADAGAVIDDVMIKDPVCGIYFPRREGVALQHGGKQYFFCSTACRDRFVKEKRES